MPTAKWYEYRRKWMKTPQGKAYTARRNKTLSRRFLLLKYRCLKRGDQFQITKDDYALMLANPCTYCGGPLDGTGAGLDRVDSSQGYVPGNVVPACIYCNQAKSNCFSYEEMLFIGKAIGEIWKQRAGREFAKAIQLHCTPTIHKNQRLECLDPGC